MTKRARALLILTQSLNDIKLNLNSIVEASLLHTSDSLYVYINRNTTASLFNTDRYLIKLITNNFYQQTFSLNPKLNTFCLLNYNQIAQKKRLNYDLILTDSTQVDLNTSLKQFCFEYLPPEPNKDLNEIQVVNIKKGIQNDDLLELDHENDLIYAKKSFDYSIVAGTFDRLHIGHKILLSESVLLTKKKLLIGITDKLMIEKKLLFELIEPLNIRIENVTKFLKSIAPHLEIEFAPLNDPFGPSITEKDYQCLIVSKETIKGGNMVNSKRIENNLQPLELHVISLIDDNLSNVAEHDENKVSSSNQRKRLLGTLLREPFTPYNQNKPYVIGLTGGLASGKSSIRKRLEKLGAVTVDCDLLGHQSYNKGTNAYEQLVETFGKGILDENLSINRRALGSLVFGNADDLKKLTDIVWPEIRNLIEAEIKNLYEKGHRIIVVEAAVLLEAKWNSVVNEIWVCFVPPEESIRRAMQRDNASLEKAKSILESQLTNTKRLECANVAFCTLWEPEYTQKQVEKAWNLLKERTYNEH